MNETPRILLVEDEAPIRRFLKIALGSGGFEAIEAERGREAVELAATRAPDAVLLDLGLPDMDGKAVITAVREWSQVPIIVLSVRDGEAEKSPRWMLGPTITSPSHLRRANSWPASGPHSGNVPPAHRRSRRL